MNKIEPKEIKQTTSAKPEIQGEKTSRQLERERDAQPVKGIFKFYEVPGGRLKFIFHQHAGDPIDRIDMVDGQVYTVPLRVARHLNKNGFYPNYIFAPDEHGIGKVKVGSKTHRFGFQSLEFIDDTDLLAAPATYNK